MLTHNLWSIKVTDSPNKNYFSGTNQTYTARYAAFYGARAASWKVSH